MKTTHALAALGLALPLVGALAADGTDRVVRLSEPVAVTETHEVFGAPLDTSAAALSLAEAITAAPGHGDREVVIETTVAQVCQKKGCFFLAEDGETVARVTFKDYGFFIPTDSSGKTVLLSGVVKPSEVTAKQADHYSSDLGGKTSPSAIAGIEYQIVASAVAVPKS
ncbi:MAG TPA: DUF4920 domain-containing protein [Steroidobacteraceae bacterium]|nr:DUF4920 domain-containing protein [Steroidobacteraceae bacterium]